MAQIFNDDFRPLKAFNFQAFNSEKDIELRSREIFSSKIDTTKEWKTLQFSTNNTLIHRIAHFYIKWQCYHQSHGKALSIDSLFANTKSMWLSIEHDFLLLTFNTLTSIVFDLRTLFNRLPCSLKSTNISP